MTVRRGDTVTSVPEGIPGLVEGIHTDGILFRVAWSDDSVSMESADEEHERWESTS